MCVLPVCRYGSENWILTEPMVTLLENFQAELGKILIFPNIIQISPPPPEKGNRTIRESTAIHSTDVHEAVGCYYSDLLELFATPTLADRRKYLSLCVMYTIVHNQVHFQPNIFVPRHLSALHSS